MSAVLRRYSPLLIIVLAWEAVTRSGLVGELTLPVFSHIVVSFWEILKDDLPFHVARSIMRGFSALGGAIVCGTVLGILMAWYRPFRILVKPVIQCFYPMPKSALIPLVIIWIGLGDSSKITLIFIGCLLPVVVSAFNAARGVDDVLIWSARSLGATEGEVLRQVVLPASLPEILHGIRVALAMSFILMVSSELIIANDGIGFLIGFLGEAGDFRGMFACAVTIAMIGFFADRLYLLATRRILAWQE
jgi:NitT/TauT family transport system permease protein